ncbi:MAG TPA: dynamin family protein [Thermoanaerobaculia bacterium]|nr:dynamin family protein [Thermoanaerobaculia bacterium]
MSNPNVGFEERPGAGAQAEEVSPLGALSLLASRAGALTVATEASLLAARVEAGLFYVACVGQFKRGKSTLLNALVGETVLPAGVVPVTSVVTVLRYGAERIARVRFESGHWRAIAVGSLPLYVSESENPENRKGVLAAEVLLPHPLLASGLCLVDTPGLGSVFEANTAATRSFIPHIDAALVVLGADPPISGEELALVADVSKTVQRFLFVLNKADRLSESERREARRFAEQQIERRLGRPTGPIFEVSATEVLTDGKPARDFRTLVEALGTLATEAGSDLVRQAQQRGIERLTARVIQSLDAREEALLRPIHESELRLESLRGSVETAERAAQDLGYLFTAEQDRLSADFAKRREAFLTRTLPGATGRLVEAIRSAAGQGGDLRRRGAALARQIAQDALEGWVSEIEPIAESRYREAMQRFVRIGIDFFEKLAASDRSFADLPKQALGPVTGFRTARRFYFNDLFELEPSSGVRRIADLSRSVEQSAAAAVPEVSEYLRQLLEHNGTRVVNDLDERVAESRRRLESDIRDRLREGLDYAVQALERARHRRAEGAEVVDRELANIAALRTQTQRIRESAAIRT